MPHAEHPPNRRKNDLADLVARKDELYPMLLGHLPQAAILLFDTEKRYHLAEGKLLENVGFRREAMLGKRLEDVVSPEGKKLLVPVYEKTLEGEAVRRQLHLADRTFSVSTTPVRNGEGRVIGGILMSLDISEETELRRRLEQSEAKLRAIINHSQQAFVFVDMEGHLQAFNRVAADFAVRWELPPLVEGTDIQQYAPDQLRVLLRKNIELVLELARPVSLEQELHFPDGRSEWHELQFVPVREEGVLAGVLITTANIDERKRAQHALERSEQRFRSLVQNSIDIISIIDADGVLVYETPVAERVFGGSSVDRIGREGFVRVHPGDQRKLEDRLHAIREIPGAIATVEFRFLARDGETAWLESVLHNRLGDPEVRGIVITSREITERRRSEEQLRLLATAISTAEEAVLITDAQLDLPGPRIVFVNEGFTRMSGYTRDEILGKTPRVLQGPKTSRTMLEELGREVERGRPFTAETVNYRKDGSEYIVEWRISPVFDSEGIITHYVSIQRDITARKLAEEEMERTTRTLEERNRQLDVARREAEKAREAVERAAEELRRAYEEAAEARREAERASEAKSQFLANMSHEIRTPMTAILGFAKLFRERELDEEVLGFVEQIVNSGEHLLNLINDILDLSRVEAGRVNIEHEPFDMEALVSEIVELYRPLATRKNIELKGSVEELPGEVVLDRGRVRQVATNLLTNAIKYTEEGVVALAVERAERGEGIVVEVSDTGLGITPEEQQHIFEPFYQVQRGNADPEGSGLGLTITARLVGAMDGEVELESDDGEGTSFRVRIPCRFATAEEPGERREVPVPEAAGASESPLTVLVADDHPANRTLIEHVLRSRGHDIVLAQDGEEAVAAFQKHAFDVVVLDVQMPRMDGYEALRRIRRLPGGNRVPVMMLTAYAMKSDRERSLREGADEYLSKPFDPDQLVDVLLRLGTVQDPASRRKLVESESLKRLRKSYLEDLVATGTGYTEHLPQAEELGIWAHRVAGSGGSFGFPGLTKTARELERLLEVEGDPMALREGIAELVSQARTMLEDPSASDGAAQSE